MNRKTVNAFQEEIYQYYSQHQRTFPWRETANPYHILVSEIMLQQTQTARVIPKYMEFIAVFPDFNSLADASLFAVLGIWQGLGYNRRALALKKIAGIVVDDYHGILPATEKELMKLPGIGKYTAAAVLAFAHNKPALVIDTNIRTVFIYYFFENEDKVDDAQLLPFIDSTLDKQNPRKWYSALFDYGAMLKKTEKMNEKSAHYHKQTPFKDSNRQLRSLILGTVLANRKIKEKEIVELLKIDKERVIENLNALQQEGFLTREKGGVYKIN